MTGRIRFATSTAPRPPLADLVSNPTPPGQLAREWASSVVLHLDRPCLRFLPRYLNRQWKPEFLVNISQTTERFARRKFDVEWQWAFIVLWQIGAVDDLIAITKIYPEKSRMFWYSGAAAVYASVKQRIKNFFQSCLTHPVRSKAQATVCVR